MNRTLITAVTLVALALPLSAANARRRPGNSAGFPGCPNVSGTPAVAMSRDGGRTMLPTSEALQGVGYTFGLAALDQAHTLLAIHKDIVYRSVDDGCTWKAIGVTQADNLANITPASGGRAYFWGDNRPYLARYENDGFLYLKSPADPLGLGVDASGNRVLLGGSDGNVWESVDSGNSWTRRGSLPAQQFPLYYRYAFDQADVEHVIAAVGSTGAWLSRDGGRTWTQSTGFGTNTLNVFNVVISPADPNVVWAEGISLVDSTRHIYLSRDGGATFANAITESAAVNLINGTLMAAHPTDPNVLYFVFGTYFQAYGTDIYRFDAATQHIETSHYDFDDINSIAFSRVDPYVMYFGLETEKRSAP